MNLIDDKINESTLFSNLEKRVLIQAVKRYKHPNGFIGHHGDCRIYSIDYPNCSCGLIHDLMVLEEPSYVFKFFEQDSNTSEGFEDLELSEPDMSEAAKNKKAFLKEILSVNK